MRASFGPFANGICVLTEKVSGPAGHFCPLFVRSLRKLVPIGVFLIPCLERVQATLSVGGWADPLVDPLVEQKKMDFGGSECDFGSFGGRLKY